jgi:TonB-dependent starch-binding outer membrane protein SusC
MKNNFLFKKQLLQKTIFICAFLLSSLLGFAQVKQYSFSGVVTNGKTKLNLSGAQLSLDDKQMAYTDFDGSYKFQSKLTEGAHTISASFYGFKTKKVTLTIGAKEDVVTNLDLFDDILNLDEIVVIGTAVNTKKKQSGNAIATIKSSEIRNSGSTSIDQALTGKVSGALISQNSGSAAGGISVTLRGTGTIVGSSDPLYIVDGVYVNNFTNNTLNLGGNNQNRLVDLNPNDIDRIEIVKGAAGAAIYGARGSNGVVQIFTKRGKNGKAKFNFSSNLKINQLRKKIDYNEVPLAWVVKTANANLATTPVQRYDFQNEIFGTTFGNEQNLSVSGANENTSYYISGGSLNNSGIIKNTNFERFGFKTNLEHKVNSFLTLNASLDYTRSTSNESPNGLLTSSTGAINGFLLGDNTVNPDVNFLGIYPSTGAFAPNPKEAINNFKFKQVTNRIVTGFGAKAKLTGRLSANYNLGIDSYNESGTAYLPIGNTVPGPESTGFARRADVNFFQFNHDLNLTYDFDINKVIKSTTVIGGTWQNDKTQSVGINATGLGIGVSNASSGINVVQGERRVENAYWGGFLQQSFAINDKLFINGAIRQDASSLYAKQNRNQLFYKASASYLISNESFWKNVFKESVNSLKLRAAWGEAGNLTALPTYSDLTTYGSSAVNGQNTLTASTQQGNDNLKPETKTEIEFGFDASFFNNRVSVEYTYYKQRVRDLLLNRELAPSTGFSSRFDNVGNLQNEGMELLVKLQAIKSKDFNWNVVVNYGRNRNEVSNIPGKLIILPDSFTVGRAAVIEGQPTGVFLGTYYARDTNGNILLNAQQLPFAQTKDGAPDNKIIGNPNPKWLGSLINEIQYKNFGFRFQFDAVQGFDVINWDRRVLNNTTLGAGGYNAGQELLGNIPKGTGSAQRNILEEFVEDGSFVKLREVSLTYNFKPKALGIENIQLSIIGRNLYSWDKYKGWDPEVNSAGQRNGFRGYIAGAIPIAKTFQFGVNVSF